MIGRRPSAHGKNSSLKAPPRWRLDDYRFWLPLLGLYTGARLSELCQLRLGDIREELGVWVISISSSGAVIAGKNLTYLEVDALGKHHQQDAAAVQRRDGDEVEHRKAHIHHH